jgi:hypothetical protein
MEARATLRLRPPLGRSLVAAAALAALVALASEAASRTGLVRGLLPTPSVGCGQPQLDAKIALLDTHVDREGPIEGLFFGSSMVYRGIDPLVVAEAFERDSGRALRSFNFGLGGLSETGEEPLAKIVVDRFRPRWLVVGASPFGLDDERGVGLTERLLANPWVRHHHGEPSLDGWLVDRSSAFRAWLGIRFWLLEPMSKADRLKIRGMMEGMKASGYGISESTRLPDLDDKTRAYFSGYELSSAHVESLARLLRLRDDVRVVLVEVPVHESVVNRFGRGDDAYRRGLDAIEEVAARTGVPFWRYPKDRPIPAEGWADYTHMNRTGAAIYSRWLGERLAAAEREGFLGPSSS